MTFIAPVQLAAGLRQAITPGKSHPKQQTAFAKRQGGLDSVHFSGSQSDAKGLTPNDEFLLGKATQWLKALQDGKVEYRSLEDQDPDYWHRVLQISMDGKPLIFDTDQESRIGRSMGTSHKEKSLKSEDGNISFTWRRDMQHSAWKTREALAVNGRTARKTLILSPRIPR